MKPPARAFYVSVSTEPISPGEGKFGCALAVVVIGAPSREAAGVWADDFAQRTIFPSQKDQKVSAKRIVELSDRLLTMDGDEQIDWERLRLEARKRTNNRWHRMAMFSSVGLDFSSGDNEAAMPEGWDDPEHLRAQLPKELAETMNWDPAHPGLYICHDEKTGVVIRATNALVASIPFAKCKDEGLPAGPHILMDSLSLMEKYLEIRPG